MEDKQKYDRNEKIQCKYCNKQIARCNISTHVKRCKVYLNENMEQDFKKMKEDYEKQVSDLKTECEEKVAKIKEENEKIVNDLNINIKLWKNNNKLLRDIIINMYKPNFVDSTEISNALVKN